MSPNVVLVVVDTERDEENVLGRLSGLQSRYNARVAPVLDRDDLPRRLGEALSRSGLQPTWIRYSDTNGQGAPASSPARFNGTPSSVLVLEGVEPGTARLAEALCGVKARHVARTADLMPAGSPGEGSCLVLVNPTRVASDAAQSAFETLARSGIPSGMLYAADPIDGRLGVLKSLLVTHIESDERYAVVSGTYAPAPHESAPACIPADDDPSVLDLLQRRQTLLVINGHSNALDVSLGKNFIMCARPANARNRHDERLFPCFDNGVCFRRQAQDGTAHARLVKPGDIHAQIILLSGCNLVAVGRSWADASKGLAYQCAQGASIAVLASANVTVSMLELDLLALTLIRKGLPLGRVACEINRIHKDVFAHANGLPSGVGPLILVGNPELRVGGARVHSLAGRKLQGRKPLSISLARLGAHQPGGAFVAIPVERRERTGFVVLRGNASDVWCRGMLHRHCDGEDDSLYLWLSTRSAEPTARRLAVTIQDEPPYANEHRQLSHFLGQFSFWTMFLDYYVAALEAKGRPTARLSAMANGLPAARRLFARALVASAVQPCVMASAASFEAELTKIQRLLERLSIHLLACVTEVACHGNVRAFGFEPYYRRTNPVDFADKCVCGEGTIAGQRYLASDGDSGSRMQYQCGVCGPIGEDDGRRIVRLDAIQKRVARGTVLHSKCTVRAPADERIHVCAAPVLEPWLRNRRIMGNSAVSMVPAGSATEVALSVKIPANLARGIYPFSVVAIVNGALYVMLQMVEVTEGPTS